MSGILRETMQDDVRHYKARLERALKHEGRFLGSRFTFALHTCYANVCAWLYADMTGDVDAACWKRWWEISDEYEFFYEEWFDDVTSRWTIERPELDGLSLIEFGEVMEWLKNLSREATYKATGKSPSTLEQNRQLPVLKRQEETAWLKGGSQ